MKAIVLTISPDGVVELNQWVEDPEEPIVTMVGQTDKPHTCSGSCCQNKNDISGAFDIYEENSPAYEHVVRSICDGFTHSHKKETPIPPQEEAAAVSGSTEDGVPVSFSTNALKHIKQLEAENKELHELLNRYQEMVMLPDNEGPSSSFYWRYNYTLLWRGSKLLCDKAGKFDRIFARLKKEKCFTIDTTLSHIWDICNEGRGENEK